MKITTIPFGSTKISIEEVKPSANALALVAEDGKPFYLNGNYTKKIYIYSNYHAYNDIVSHRFQYKFWKRYSILRTLLFPSS